MPSSAETESPSLALKSVRGFVAGGGARIDDPGQSIGGGDSVFA